MYRVQPNTLKQVSDPAPPQDKVCGSVDHFNISELRLGLKSTLGFFHAHILVLHQWVGSLRSWAWVSACSHPTVPRGAHCTRAQSKSPGAQGCGPVVGLGACACVLSLPSVPEPPAGGVQGHPRRDARSGLYQNSRDAVATRFFQGYTVIRAGKLETLRVSL